MRHVPTAIHLAAQSKGVIVSCPGYKSSMDGYNNKYVTLGDHLASLGFSVVRMANTTRPEGPVYRHGLLQDMRQSIALAGSQIPEVPMYLMGFSAGGFACAALAHEFPRVRGVLLMEPATNPALLGPLPLAALRAFHGEAYIVVGDSGVGASGGSMYLEAFTGASKKELVVIPECDHQFTGARNGKIMSKAPLWAFDGERTFPSPDGGLELY